MKNSKSLPARGDAVALTRALVRIDSRNPTLVSGAPGERDAADFLARVLDAWGFDVNVDEAAPGRANVVATIGDGDRSLMLNGHLDTVGVDGMTHAPFDAELRDGRIYGRGSADMKAGIGAMCAAAVRACESARCRVIVTAVCDEEYESLGMRELIARGVTADAAIVTEPTRLQICPGHRGFVWLVLRFAGRAAHGSRYDIGVDAVSHAGLFLSELHELERETLARTSHPLLGRASVHASTIGGGVGFSTYPEECVLRVERRTLPGETPARVVEEAEAALARAKAREPRVQATIEIAAAQPPGEVASDAPIVRTLERAARDAGLTPRIEGMSAWTDAALLNAAGIPAVLFGPGDIALAHAAEEYVSVNEIERATDVLERVVREWASHETASSAAV